MAGDREQQPTVTLPRDEFTTARRALQDNPGAFGCGSTVYVTDDYGNLVTWVIETFRADGKVTHLLQRDGVRWVLPPQVALTLESHRDRCATQARRRAARQAVQTRLERGDTLGNPEALKAARKAPRKPRRKRRARKSAKGVR